MDDLRVVFARWPWWVPFPVAGVLGFLSYLLVGSFLRALMGSAAAAAGSQSLESLHSLAELVAWVVALLVLLAGLVGNLDKLSRRSLLRRQASIESIGSLSWQAFEQLVGEAYRRIGFTVTETGGGGADGRIDLILRRGKEKILVQCKHWRIRQVGVGKVRELFGLVAAEAAGGGILITSGSFTPAARKFARGKDLELVDGDGLVALVSEARQAMGLQPVTGDRPKQETPATGPVCPICGRPMVLRTARRGSHAGSTFWGCSAYPSCKGKRSGPPSPAA